MAEDVVNGAQVNATIYYVLSQVPTPLHSIHAVDQGSLLGVLSRGRVRLDLGYKGLRVHGQQILKPNYCS